MKNLVIFSVIGAISAAALAQSLEDRIDAANLTASSADNPCNDIHPFYWEIGDSSAKIASAPVGASAPSATTMMSIASASKWMWGAAAVQFHGTPPVLLPAASVQFLTMTSGYKNLIGDCSGYSTVNACLSAGTNSTQSAAWIGTFYYNSGHFQVEGSTTDVLVGTDTVTQLTHDMKSRLGTYHTFYYTQPLPAGGLVSSADDYAGFLRDILSGTFANANGALGLFPVCGSVACGASAITTPIPSSSGEVWHYSLGHWVEDDPTVGDGAFSSAGSKGFYPWIDSTKTWYGVLARTTDEGDNVGYQSAKCGRLIRKAWITGIPQ